MNKPEKVPMDRTIGSTEMDIGWKMSHELWESYHMNVLTKIETLLSQDNVSGALKVIKQGE